MLIYILLVPSIGLIVLTSLELLAHRKHDRVLFAWAQLRRNILALLREQGTTMSDKEYAITNQLLECVGVTIHDFSYFKSELFNVRRIKNLARARVESVRGLGKLSSVFEAIENKDIRKLQSEFKYCTIRSIFAYTPLITSEVIIAVLATLGKLLVKMSIKKGRNMLVYTGVLREDLKWIKKPEHHYNLYSKYEVI